MANTKITKKARLFYRSLSTKPCRTISEPEVRHSIIEQLKIVKQSNEKKIVVGLSASLRCLKNNLSKAVLIDSNIPKHIALYLTEYANKIAIPIVQLQNLDEVFAHSALVITILDKDIRLVDHLKTYRTADK